MNRFKNLTDRHFEIALAAAVLIAHLVLALGNVHAVLNWFLTDDAFYYFKVAQNVSEGIGFTFDGVNLSNGFQPLWMFVCIPIFSLARFDLILPLRVTIMVMAALNAGGSILLFRLLKRYLSKEIAILVPLVWAFSHATHSLTTKHGLENGINAFFLILLWERLTAFNSREQIGRADLKHIVGLGLIGALTILSRLDNVFLVFFAAVWLWLRWWNPPAEEGENFKSQWWWRFRTGVAFNGIIVAIMSAYLAWNKFHFGDYMPVSGKVKLWWGSLPYSLYGYRVTNWGELLAELFADDNKSSPWSLVLHRVYDLARWWIRRQGEGITDVGLARTALIAGLLLALPVLALLWIKRQAALEKALDMGLPTFFIGTLVQVAYYKRMGSVPQKAWYWISEMVLIILCFALLLHLLHSLLQTEKAPWLGRAALVVIVLVSLWMPVSFFNYIWGELENGLAMETHDYLHRAEFLAETFEPGTMVAITGSGSWGYFSGDIIIFNMDGLINSYEYLDYMQQGRGAEFLHKSGVQFVLGNPYILTNVNPYGPMLADHLENYTKYYPPYGNRKFVWSFLP